MKELVFLPDREGRDELTAASGLVRVGEDLESLTSRLVLPRAERPCDNGEMWRGVLALALLCDAWPGEAVKVTTLTVDSTTSLFAAWVLSARPAAQRRDALHLVLLEKGDERRLLGIADVHAGIVLPATATDFTGFVPARAAWYDADREIWHDPVPFLNEHDRAILLARLTMMGLDAPEIVQLKEELACADKVQVEAVKNEDAAALEALSTRMEAVCGLKDFAAYSVRMEPCAVTQDNPFVRLYSAVDVRYTAERVSSTCLWNGVPFARTSAALGLTGTNDPAQDKALAEIRAEADRLRADSVRWNADCADGITDWLLSQDDALLPQVKNQAEELRHQHMDRARDVQQTVTLVWPWDASSGAVKYLLRENLGDGWLSAAANPFSDVLTKLTGHVLGDTALENCCACADGILLPPLSREMAACAANAAEGMGLALDMLRFEPREDGGITASFLLKGAGEVRMVRTYPIDEILVLKEAASPSVAVWPCLPMEHWHAYHVFARCAETEVAVLSGGEWESLPAEPAEDGEETLNRPWRCLRTAAYPACLCILQGERCLGALPNMLPLLQLEAKGEARVAIDMGASATAAVITVDDRPVSASGEPLTRLLVAPQDMPADDFLLSLTPMELTPSAVQLTGEGDELFADGHVYAVTRFEALRALTPGTVCTALKWRADAKSVRARRILLHQVMLGASLNAMMAGAESIRWRLTVADEMADEGRAALLDMAEALAHGVAEETGLALTKGKAPVAWAEEAAALHAYLRGEGGMKGTFAVLDVGGGSTKLHLWLQGRQKPIGGAVLMEGASTALLSALRDQPELLREDFADCGNEPLIAAVDVLCEQLMLAGESLAQSDKALLMLDALLEEFRQPITQHLYARFAAQQVTNMQSILLEMLAAAVFNVGLMLEQAGNDTNINHYFPGDLTICVTGRGAWLLDSLTPQLRNGLQRIAHEPMQLRHPVRSLSLTPTAMPALGTALGLAAIKDPGTTNDTPIIRTRQSFAELMGMLMTQLHRNCPLHVWQLHPGLFDAWGVMTAAGMDTIRRVASACYGEGEDIPGSVMTFVRRLRRTPILVDEAASPGE